MPAVVAILRESPLLLLFLVAALGYLVGRIRVAGFGLGIAAVLFVGLGAGALDPELKLPELVSSFGLVLFVYTIGVAGGPGFFASFQRRGLRDSGFAALLTTLAAALTTGAALLLGLDAPLAAGLYCGSTTNTPALAGVVQALREGGVTSEAALAVPVVAYSVAYPMGVVGVLLALWLVPRILRADLDEMPPSMRAAGLGQHLVDLTVRVTRLDATHAPLAELRRQHGLRVLFGRLKRGSETRIVDDETRLALGDLVTVIGNDSSVHSMAALLGELSDERLDLDRHAIDFRRIFVSNPALTGKRLAELRLSERFGAIITRIRRGDVELLADSDTVLELGDRIRVVAPRDRIDEVSRHFGDSYRALAEVDVVTFSLGIALGLAFGMLPVPMPGGSVFKLGYAGGPLIVGLVLGRLGRSGPLVWTLPYSANLTLRQLGLVLFLAGVGTRSGHAFASTLAGGGGLVLFAAGAVVTALAATAGLVAGSKLLRIPMGLLIGIVAGVHTQPAALAFASEQTKSDLPNLGYTTVFPIATITKIVLAQVVLILLR
jgi:putative transport protein